MAFNPDEAAIVALLKKERLYRDTSQWEKLRSQYHPDANEDYINVSWFQGDADKFVEQSQNRPSTTQGIEIDHFIDPNVIEIRGNRAISDSAIFIKRPVDYKNHEYELGSRLRALNRFLKVAGEWKIVALEVVYIRDRLISTSPNPPKEPILLDDSLFEFPREYRWMAWVMLMEGKRDPKKDLPRNGNIEEVRQMVARNEKFLEEGA